jgi:hypothetical protein
MRFSLRFLCLGERLSAVVQPRRIRLQLLHPRWLHGAGDIHGHQWRPAASRAQLFKADATLQEMEKFLKNPRGEPPLKIEEAGGLGAIAPGTDAFVDLDLSPGTYAFVCFVPDQKTGQPHFALGMAAPLELKG